MSVRMPSFSLGSLMPVVLFAAGALSAIGYGYLTRDNGGKATSAPQVALQRTTAGDVERGTAGQFAARSDHADPRMGSEAAHAGSARAEEHSSLRAASGALAPAGTGPLPLVGNGSLEPASAAGEGASTTNGKAALVATPENVAIWIAHATDSDAARRAAAIEALAAAPKTDAVPVLAQVLDTADDADRPRALRSLRTLAQREGDADERIRGVVRKIVFHADDESAARSAQAMLDDIDRDLNQARSNTR